MSLWGRPQKSLLSHFFVTFAFSGFRALRLACHITTPESQKSPKRVQKSGFRLFSDSFETPGRTLSGLWGSHPEALFQDSFRTLPGFRARRARETLCRAGPILTIGYVQRFQSKKGVCPLRRVPERTAVASHTFQAKNPDKEGNNLAISALRISLC